MKKYSEEMNTYNKWQRKGYQVKRSQRSAYSKNNSPLFGRSQVVRKRTKYQGSETTHVTYDENVSTAGAIIFIAVVVVVYWVFHW